jgi:hypothetical protein
VLSLARSMDAESPLLCDLLPEIEAFAVRAFNASNSES